MAALAMADPNTSVLLMWNLFRDITERL